MTVCDSIKYVGVDDHEIDLFEGQFEVPNGMAYNSYIIIDEKVAVMDSVDANFGEQWLKNIAKVLEEAGGRKPDYLIVQHMEMDHSANIKKFADTYPQAKLVASKMAFNMMKSMFGTDFADRQILAGEGTELELGAAAGDHTLRFISAPNVHWPEVIMTYDVREKVLFAADAFGKFGANDYDDPEGWACEARRYYFGIVGKFGPQVQAVLKKAQALEIKTICSLHGPVLSDNIKYYLDTYNTWSSYGVESEGIVVNYTSVYGSTKKAAEKIAQLLREKGCPKVALNDLAREDIYECVEDAFRYGKMILATTTYCGGVFPKMREFIEHLTERNYQNRKIGLIENGSWMPSAAKGIVQLFEGSKDISFAENKVSIKITMTEENEAELEKLADEMLAN